MPSPTSKIYWVLRANCLDCELRRKASAVSAISFMDKTKMVWALNSVRRVLKTLFRLAKVLAGGVYIFAAAQLLYSGAQGTLPTSFAVAGAIQLAILCYLALSF